MEKIPLAGIARVLKISEPWLQNYVNVKYEAGPRQVTVQPKPKGRLTVQMDELWSFVDDKGNEQSVWLALDVATSKIVGCYIGDLEEIRFAGRTGESAKALWRDRRSQQKIFCLKYWFHRECHLSVYYNC